MREFRNPSNAKERPCPRCSTGRIMTGNQAQFNAKDEAGKQVCIDCKLKEIYGQATTTMEDNISEAS
jgi:hypothetical protein